MIIDDLPATGTISTSDEFPVEIGTATYKATISAIADAFGLGTASQINAPVSVANGGTGATTEAGARANLGFSFFQASKAAFNHYGGDNGVEIRITGTDGTLYSLTFYVNALTVSTSTDGGQTWTPRVTLTPTMSSVHYETVSATTDVNGNILLPSTWTSRCIIQAVSSYPGSIPTVGTSADSNRFVHVSDHTGANAIASTALIIGLYYLA